MAADINRFGLRRYVPEDIKRVIRKRCGFGCVVCGLAFYDYEHFNPDFADAETHNPEGMTLLCMQCNQKRARTRLSPETVARANASPKCLENGFASELFDFGPDPIAIKFGGLTFYDCRHLLVVNGVPLLSVNPPEEQGQPMRLSGRLTDRNGRTTLSINDNEFKVKADLWDIECVGPKMTFRNGLGDICLILKMRPPHAIDIERLEMVFSGVHFSGTAAVLRTSFDGRNWNTFEGCDISECLVGLSMDSGARAANDGYFPGLL